MPQTVYVESSVISLLAARRSRDAIQRAHQELTEEWWARERSKFEVFTSQLVIDEVSLGDARVARRRLVLLEGLPLLDATREVDGVAERLVRLAAVPREARADAYHIALATVHGIDYLLTWNCRHIANAYVRARIEAACASLGFRAPSLCTPEELVPE